MVDANYTWSRDLTNNPNDYSTGTETLPTSTVIMAAPPTTGPMF